MSLSFCICPMVVMVPFPASEDLSRILNRSDSEKQWLACPLLEDDKVLNHSSCCPCFALEEGKSQAGRRGGQKPRMTQHSHARSQLTPSPQLCARGQIGPILLSTYLSQSFLIVFTPPPPPFF